MHFPLNIMAVDQELHKTETGIGFRCASQSNVIQDEYILIYVQVQIVKREKYALNFFFFFLQPMSSQKHKQNKNTVIYDKQQDKIIKNCGFILDSASL